MTALVAVLVLGAIVSDAAGAPHIKAAQAAFEDGKQAQAEKQIERASECFRKAIDIEPTYIEAREALIETYLDAGQKLSGAAAITELLEIEPEALKYRIVLAKILLEQRQWEKALAQFSLVLRSDAGNAEGLLGFAAAARRMGMNDRADHAIKHGRKLYPDDKRFREQAGGTKQ